MAWEMLFVTVRAMIETLFHPTIKNNMEASKIMQVENHEIELELEPRALVSCLPKHLTELSKGRPQTKWLALSFEIKILTAYNRFSHTAPC
jgi:hypothetical protein